MKKKLVSMIVMVTMVVVMLSGCGGANSISVISREEGSGTRGAFIELFGVEEKDSSGNKVDHTTEEATQIQSTSVMMTTVAGDENAIGYISLGSLNDSVKAIKINGVDATVANIKSKAYEISRPFNIVTKDGKKNELATDFISFIMSADGQAVTEEAGYISNDNKPAYAGKKPAGKIVVAGSSSVTPVMEKLKEAYLKVNTSAEIEVQQSDSSTGVSAAIAGTCDIGMASRELKDTETSEGVKSTVICTDGIAVIVNKNSKISDLTKDQVKQIYTGSKTSWDDVK